MEYTIICAIFSRRVSLFNVDSAQDWLGLNWPGPAQADNMRTKPSKNLLLSIVEKLTEVLP